MGTSCVPKKPIASISDRLDQEESQALPTVIAIDGIYHMFFCYRQSVDFRGEPGPRLSHRTCLHERLKPLDPHAKACG